MLRQISLLVKGADFPNRLKRGREGVPRRFEIALCVPGEPVELVLEPDNPADPDAIRILSARGVQLGYVAAERAPLIGRHIRQGDPVAAIFQEATAHGAVIRLSLDGGAPVLPPARPVVAPAPVDESGDGDDGEHYFRDPIWPDD